MLRFTCLNREVQRWYCSSLQTTSTLPPQSMTDTTQLVPYGYTATGRVRKIPLKNSQQENPVPEPNRYEKFKYTYRKFLNCPACYKDFSHRPDSHRAVWQHLLHFATVAKEPKHQKARDALKEIRDRTPTGM